MRRHIVKALALALLVCMASVAIIVVLAVAGPLVSAPRMPTTPSPADRRLLSPSPTIAEMWRRDDLTLPSFTRSALLCTQQAVVFLDWRTNELTALNPVDGAVAWRIQTGALPKALATTPSHVFSLHGGRIHAFSAQDATPIWTSNDPLPEHMSYRIEPVGDRIRVYSNEHAATGREQVIRAFDITNGELVETSRIPDGGTAQIELRMATLDLWEDGEAIWGVSQSLASTLWRQDIPGPVDTWPIAEESKVIIAAGLPSELRAIDTDTGRTIWSYAGGFVSNPVAYSGRVYALQQDASLVQIDEETGKKLRAFPFSPPLQDQAGTVSAYWIAVCNGTLYLYFGDLGELVAFRLDSAQ